MPRYCAVACCSNRSGQLSSDNQKLGFYPFPLQNKERLNKWIKNMKHDNWFPTKHQCICSEHFTADSFEWRWGIRYLKPQAVPTVFPFSSHQQKKKLCSRYIRRKNNFPKEQSETNPQNFGPAATNEVTTKERLESSVPNAECDEQSQRNSELNTASESLGNPEQSFDTTLAESFITIKELETNQLFNDQQPFVTENVLQVEHSYCRHGTGKAQLWEKIFRLQKKIKKLQQQEQRTAAKLKKMEQLIEHLRKEDLTSEEKMKFLIYLMCNQHLLFYFNIGRLRV
ncbi:THAP domain-containing protein 5-like isoform X1 [Chiloscyllium plagiosum]|uniref:THAP domain-containing protein 5-like isoform X1 n=1 Tax=Chiloscyllium plagiosum TaxID=36176 RepID=UPI001CB822DA|nr:THAP domain-containing protein 5-like isoform X1 [Chiloscyllium plagiosum]